MASKPFKGIIKLDVRDSVADWEPYTPKKAPAGSPNILFVLYDDTGLAAWSHSADASTCRRCRSWRTTG
jgi:arylsulfatase